MDPETQQPKSSTARGRKTKAAATTKTPAAKKAASKTPRKAAAKRTGTTTKAAAKRARATAPAATPVEAAPAGAPAKPSATTTSRRGITAEERYRMIAEAAYYRAQKRGFAPGHHDHDWRLAEAEIDAMLLRQDRAGKE